MDDQDITDKKTNIMKIRQNVGMVFQHFHLFPHKTVMENLTYAPMKVKGISKEEAEKKVLNYWKRLDLRKRQMNIQAVVRRTKTAGGDCTSTSDGTRSHAF